MSWPGAGGSSTGVAVVAGGSGGLSGPQRPPKSPPPPPGSRHPHAATPGTEGRALHATPSHLPGTGSYCSTVFTPCRVGGCYLWQARARVGGVRGPAALPPPLTEGGAPPVYCPSPPGTAPALRRIRSRHFPAFAYSRTRSVMGRQLLGRFCRCGRACGRLAMGHRALLRTARCRSTPDRSGASRREDHPPGDRARRTASRMPQHHGCFSQCGAPASAAVTAAAGRR